jgi:hypothetical protein
MRRSIRPKRATRLSVGRGGAGIVDADIAGEPAAQRVIPRAIPRDRPAQKRANFAQMYKLSKDWRVQESMTGSTMYSDHSFWAVQPSE